MGGFTCRFLKQYIVVFVLNVEFNVTKTGLDTYLKWGHFLS